MIEKTIRDYLNNTMLIPTYLEIPKDPPERFIVIEKTSGGRKNKVESSAFAMQSYAESLFHAAELNQDLKNAVERMVVLDEIASVRLNSDYNFTDAGTKQYRYQAVFDIKHY